MDGTAPGKGIHPGKVADREEVQIALKRVALDDPAIVSDLCNLRFTVHWLRGYIKVRTKDRGPDNVVTHYEAMRHVMAKTTLRVSKRDEMTL